MTLDELLETRSPAVLRRWGELVTGEIVPASTPETEQVGDLPGFLVEIVQGLRNGRRGFRSAGDHGRRRLKLGFGLEGLAREFGALQRAITDTAAGAGIEPSGAELELLFDLLANGIADAIREYALQRDAELIRQANHRFAFIAHELRNPLDSAGLFFQLLSQREHPAANDPLFGALGRSLQQSGELIRVMVARATTAIDPQIETTRLQPLLEAARLAVLGEAESRGIELRLVAGDDREIEIDSRLVRSAVGAILLNAIRTTPRGNAVELRWRLSDHRAVVEVEDRCGGLPPGKVEQALVPFVSLDIRQNSFALALDTAKQAAAAHGGSARVQNLPGTGCLFALEIPIVEDDPTVS